MRRTRATLLFFTLITLVIAGEGCDDETQHVVVALAPSATGAATRTASAVPTPTPTVATSTPAAATATSTVTRSAATQTAAPTPTADLAVMYRAPARNEPAGPRSDGSGVLPNGRIVTPSGRQATLATLPLTLRVGATGHVFVTNDGNGNDDLQRYLQVVEPHTLDVHRTAAQHFVGLSVSPDGHRIYAANGPDDRVDVFDFDGTTLIPVADAAIQLPPGTFPLGLDLSGDGRTLYAVGFLTNTFWRIDVTARTAQQAAVNIGNFPYGVVVARDGQRAYVTSWGINNGNRSDLSPRPLPPTNANAGERSSVAIVNVSGTGAPQLVRYVGIGRLDNHTVFGGAHPSALALSPDGALLYVTASNIDHLAVIDTAAANRIADVDLNVFGDGSQGLYPNAVAVSADGRRLYVADAGINAVQVIDVDAPARAFTPRGFIPTGWYPSAVGLSADGMTLYVASGKGRGVAGNGAQLVDISTQTLGATPYYIGRIISGLLSAIDLGSVDLDRGTAAVRANNGFDPVPIAAGSGITESPVPITFGAGPSTQIRYVVFILKENRTYDQVFGDLEHGNGDSRLTLFGEDVTPNHHALARQFAFGDNFYDDAEVSYPGHEWITQGNNNDFVEKIWPFEYNGLLGAPFNIETGQEGFCRDGYIFEAFQRQGVPLRVYGEPLAFNSRFAAGIDGGGVPSTLRRLIDAFGDVESLVGHVGDLLAGNLDKLRAAGVNVDILTNEVWPHLKLDYPSNIQPDKTDVFRAELFLQELAEYAGHNDLPKFLFIWLPNDHTFGAAPNQPTPRSAVADNDRGLGIVVEGLTHSPFWPQMAIFVSEDDAQDGQDHVSAHRTLSLVMSPYVKRGYVSAVHHSNVSMLKTMELLLGVAPMSQYDRYATDMRDYFTTTADATPFSAAAARVRPETNPRVEQAPNALLREAGAVSQTLNLSEYDEAGPELSRVLWLVHVGEGIERQRRWATAAVTAMFASLVAAGAAVQRRRAAVARAE